MKKFSIIISAAILLLVSCTKNFEELNTNPNESDKVNNPGVLFTNVIRGSVNSVFNNSYARGVIAGDMNFNDFSSNFSNWVRADAPGYFLWNNYNHIRDLNEVISLAENGNLNNYKGIALVMRSWIFQNITDLYGPIPFREAALAKLDGIYSPRFEKQEDVYSGMLRDLEEAATLLGSTNENVIGDILYNGNIQNWKKFNTGLMIRLLMRQSKKVDPTAALTSITGNPTKYPVFANHSEQAALQYIADTRDNNMPLFNRSNSDYSTSTRVTKNLVDHLTAINDPRLPVYALPTPESIDDPVNPDVTKFKYAGAINGNGPMDDPKKYSPPGMLWAPEQYNPTLASNNSAQGLMLTYSEVQFNLAEAAERGYISGGTAVAETYYLNGIKDQFEYYSEKVGNRYANSFLKLKAEDVIPDNSYYTQQGVAYSGPQDEKLEKIALQKWLSLYFVGYESWSEWRRTGFPEIPVGTAGPGFIARRVLYPADEMRINEDNYNEAVQWLGTDDLKTRVWWDE